MSYKLANTNKKRRTAVCLWPDKYGRTVDASAVSSDYKEWLVYFHGDSDDSVLSLCKTNELYFGPPDVYAALGL